ncbi:hypothetical protein [Streptomyces goshikiensis]|uniref:hypothetical protein n=1 Tax=Streptomyces goshikiensis TaxID=1942 RepID=UPI0036A641ED
MADPTAHDARPQGSALPLLASVCATAAMGSAIVVATKAGLLFDQRLWTMVFFVAAGLLGLAAGWWVCRLLGFGRRPLTIRTTVVALALGAGAVWATGAVASQVWKTAWQRYADELGGPGACLSGTPYGQRWASVIQMPSDSGHPMEVWSGAVDGSTRAAPTKVLRLAFDTSRTHRLTPADAASRELLDSYGCR